MTAARAPGPVVIRLRLRHLRQLFNEMDPSPFHERDLDPAAEEFVVEWAREAPRQASLALVVQVDEPSGRPGDEALLREAIAGYFGRRGAVARRQLRELLGRGRVSLAIGLAFLALATGLGDVMTRVVAGNLGTMLGESLVIGGWVAMWRPLEVFLYDWWPIRSQARQFERLAAMPVRLEEA